ncbi:hypothetical protein LIER_25270 [Lithospermum erythrorhizon]|uniref:Bifunctional inhibitor/plant lipid transfer protein/seed storage helical domain-containing protein n=1 Tax=Lithospermum erythrorhizon TaxID=34254 RepID=A0AAV3R5P2_LITER
MEPKYVTWASLASILLLVFIDLVASDITQDKEKCTNQLIGLGTCLPYVSGDAKTPAPDCCTGMNEVMAKSKDCVCILIKDRNDPSLGLKINVSLALALPLKCHSPDPNLSECPAILHLPPNSPDAKVFEEFARSEGSNSTSNSTVANVRGFSAGRAKGTTAAATNEGKSTNQFKNEMALGLLVVVFFTSIIINNIDY